jgi:hypothetical protein
MVLFYRFHAANQSDWIGPKLRWGVYDYLAGAGLRPP